MFCSRRLSSGVVLPVWNPQNPSVGDKVARAIVYFVALIYMFLGMSIIADRFMSSIEVGKVPLPVSPHGVTSVFMSAVFRGKRESF